ncbi:heme-binding domain-containing protein [Limnovirga soli]|uniref:Cytochrome C n=1 Tax=Limnovirga soli TaxID=2656915 RepID=A0A8J8FCN6_9BACT|nr:heme-binding domain-containing protein [Limnovirga soli]NNV54128.1 cytochrome C [Limnovirga soli]
MKKKILIVLIALLVIIQFFKPEKNIAAGPMVNNINNQYHPPKQVSDVFVRSCYDCHSNNTVYPWYANIQPVAWWLNDHVVEGKDELNFDEFASYTIGRKYKKLEEITEQLDEGEMPLFSYTIIHRNAILTDEEKQAVTNWCNALRDTIKANYPADSLLRKKPQ